MAGLNAVMAMNPIMLIVMVVIVLIGLFYALFAWFNNLTGAALSATGTTIGLYFYLGNDHLNIL